MKPIITNPTWHDIDKGCQIIVQKFLQYQIINGLSTPLTIVGLSRGGLVPAVVISHALENLSYENVVVPVSYSSKVGNGDGKNHDNKLPMLRTESILIIDDIIDGGHTMKEVYDFYVQRHVTHTASLYYKESAVFQPTYYWQLIPENSPWIIFPFE